jgi:hypothetical protein
VYLSRWRAGYTGGALALLTGRQGAYGYRHTERFLSALARASGAVTLTDALAEWNPFRVEGHHTCRFRVSSFDVSIERGFHRIGSARRPGSKVTT